MSPDCVPAWPARSAEPAVDPAVDVDPDRLSARSALADPLVPAALPDPALPVLAAFMSRPAVALVVRFASYELFADAPDDVLEFIPARSPIWPPLKELCIEDALQPDATRTPEIMFPDPEVA